MMLKPTWTTRDGTVVAIKDMDDRHLVNIIRMMSRNAEALLDRTIRLAWQALSTMHGEMAIDSVERDINALESMAPADYLEKCTAYPALLEEAEGRGLALDTEPPSP